MMMVIDMTAQFAAVLIGLFVALAVCAVAIAVQAIARGRLPRLGRLAWRRLLPQRLVLVR